MVIKCLLCLVKLASAWSRKLLRLGHTHRCAIHGVVCLFVCLSVCLFVCLSVCASVCQSVSLNLPSSSTGTQSDHRPTIKISGGDVECWLRGIHAHFDNFPILSF